MFVMLNTVFILRCTFFLYFPLHIHLIRLHLKTLLEIFPCIMHMPLTNTLTFSSCFLCAIIWLWVLLSRTQKYFFYIPNPGTCFIWQKLFLCFFDIFKQRYLLPKYYFAYFKNPKFFAKGADEPLKFYLKIYGSSLHFMSFDMVNMENRVFFLIISTLAILSCKIQLKTLK